MAWPALASLDQVAISAAEVTSADTLLALLRDSVPALTSEVRETTLLPTALRSLALVAISAKVASAPVLSAPTVDSA